jgi:putative DNA primase/helicase
MSSSKEINWQTYPYNSSDRYSLENRANKVKERVFNCTTNNELNQLLFSRQGTEVELNWLVENYLTETEVKQLNQIKNSTQGNLFLAKESVEVIEYQYEEVIASIDEEMKRLGWSVEQGQKYLSDRYNKKSRMYLSDEAFLFYLLCALAGIEVGDNMDLLIGEYIACYLLERFWRKSSLS